MLPGTRVRIPGTSTHAWRQIWLSWMTPKLSAGSSARRKLDLASEFEGQESKIADYSLDVPHLFLGLLSFCKPDATATFASHLQDTLQARLRHLLPVWNEHVLEAQNIDLAATELTLLKRATLDFITQLLTLHERPQEERLSPDMMYLSVAQFSSPKIFYQDETIPTARTEAFVVCT